MDTPLTPEQGLPLFAGALPPTPTTPKASAEVPSGGDAAPGRARAGADQRVLLARGRIGPRQTVADAIRAQQGHATVPAPSGPLTPAVAPLVAATPTAPPDGPTPSVAIPEWVRRLVHGSTTAPAHPSRTGTALSHLQPVEAGNEMPRAGRAALPGTMAAPTLGRLDTLTTLGQPDRYSTTHRAEALRRAEAHQKARGTGRYILVGLVAAFLGATQSVLSRRDTGRALLEDLRALESATKRLRAQEAEARQLWQFAASRPALATAAAALRLEMPADSQIVLWPVVRRTDFQRELPQDPPSR